MDRQSYNSWSISTIKGGAIACRRLKAGRANRQTGPKGVEASQTAEASREWRYQGLPASSSASPASTSSIPPSIRRPFPTTKSGCFGTRWPGSS